jgi:hypothetical protein
MARATRARKSKTNPQSPEPLIDIGRDVYGRFKTGNPGGPGNPFARKCAALRKALLDAVTEDDIMDMTRVLVLLGKTGDKEAIKLLWQYAVGKPLPAKDPDRMDIEEWQWLQDMRVDARHFEDTPQSVPACFASHFAQVAWACKADDHLRQPVRAALDQWGEPDAEGPTRQEPSAKDTTPQGASAPSPNGGKAAPQRPPVPPASGKASPSANGKKWLVQMKSNLIPPALRPRGRRR